jgi:hypothetical protein
MSDEHTGDSTVVESPRRRRGRPPKEPWKFDPERADRAHTKALNAAKACAKAEVSVPSTRRKLNWAIHDFFWTLISPEELRPLKRTAADIVYGPDKRGLPKHTTEFLEEREIPAPHLNAGNPLLGMYHHFLQDALIDVVDEDDADLLGITEEDAELTQKQAASANEEDQRVAQAKNTSDSRWAWALCAAIDLENSALLNDNPRDVEERYRVYRAKKDAVLLSAPYRPRPTTKRGTKETETKDKTETTDTESAGGDLDEVPDTSVRDPAAADLLSHVTMMETAADTGSKPAETCGETPASSAPETGGEPSAAERASEPETVRSAPETTAEVGEAVEAPTSVPAVEETADELVKGLRLYTRFAEPQTTIPFHLMPRRGLIVYEKRDGGQVHYLGYVHDED